MKYTSILFCVLATILRSRLLSIYFISWVKEKLYLVSPHIPEFHAACHCSTLLLCVTEHDPGGGKVGLLREQTEMATEERQSGICTVSPASLIFARQQLLHKKVSKDHS